MPDLKKIIFCVPALLSGIIIHAQSNVSQTITDEGIMRSEAKIYVVMAVVLTILAGFLLYLFRLDRKISRLEKADYNNRF